MPRATTKTELISSATAQWDKLWKMVDALPDAKSVVFDFGDDLSAGLRLKLKEAHWQRDKNLRDVFIHLYEWHTLLLNWTAANMNDPNRAGSENKPFLPEPYTWKTYGDMNVELWQKHQSTPFDDAKSMLCDSHREVMALIDGFSNEELFEKKYFPWTGTTNIGSYCISVTASHYDWAIKKIKQYVKTSRDR